MFIITIICYIHRRFEKMNCIQIKINGNRRYADIHRKAVDGQKFVPRTITWTIIITVNIIFKIILYKLESFQIQTRTYNYHGVL